MKPPFDNGIMELSSEQRSKMLNALTLVLSIEPKPRNWHELVAVYNQQNPEMLINGDTAKDILGDIF